MPLPRVIVYLAAVCGAAGWTLPHATTGSLRRLTRIAASEQVSPFEDGAVAGSSTLETSDDLTVANVDMILEQVRPYLISDGGNVKVIGTDADARTVTLELVGACGSCPSSTTTMKMGIERVLKEKWPDLSEVIEMSSGPNELDIGIAYEALSQIMPAISGLGGSVRIVSASTEEGRGKVAVEYTGPEKIKYGMELALKDHALIDDVEFVDRE